MKRILNILKLLALIPLFFIQCESEDDLVTEGALEGGLMDMLNSSLNYVVGNTGAYTLSMKVYQGEVKSTKINLYKSFYSVLDDTVGGSPWSNEILESTIDISNQKTHTVVSPQYFYADLIDGLTINGDPLPASDGNLSIGDAFYFRAVTTTEDGREVEQGTKVKLTVSKRYAGKYKTVDALYFRIGVLTYEEADWPSELTIESVDAITYKMVEYLGPFEGNTLYFQIDANGIITYPAEWAGAAQILNDQPIITCTDNPADMTNVNCGSSNFVVNDDVNGKDKLYMSIGYYTAGSGPREFYQVLEKIVE